jgi:hypothetical protein
LLVLTKYTTFLQEEAKENTGDKSIDEHFHGCLPPTVENSGHNKATSKKTYEGYVSTNRQLSRTAQSVAARSTPSQSGPEHGHSRAQEGDDGPLAKAAAKTVFPHVRQSLPAEACRGDR